MVNDRVIAKYIRLSSEDLDVETGEKEESVSVTAQRKLIENYIYEHTEFAGFPVKEYVDDGFSGTNFDRPAFQRMMDDARRGKLSVIIVKDLSRFGRDHLEVGNYLERILPILQVRLIAVNDGYDSACFDGMTGGMSVALHNIINAMYSRDLSAKVKSAQRTRAERGECLAAIPAFGYMKDPADKHHLLIDNEAAETVKQIFELVASGKKKREIISYLNSNGIMTPAEYKALHGIRKIAVTNTGTRLWDTGTINGIIRNECYIGVSVWNKTGNVCPGSRKQVKKDKSEWIRAEGTHEPIVSKELFRKANEVLEKSRRNRSTVRTSGTRKALFICPYCNHALRKTTSKKRYVCRMAFSSGIEGCKTLRIDREKLERTILELVNVTSLLAEQPSGDQKFKGGTAAGDSEFSFRMGQIEQEQLRKKSEKLKIYTDYRSGSLTKEAYLEAYEKIVKQLSDLAKEEEQLKRKKEEWQEKQGRIALETDKLKAASALKEFDKGKLLTVIEKVLVYDDEHIEVRWKCREFNEMSIADRQYRREPSVEDGMPGEKLIRC